jgi:hypothetical protein
MIVVASRTYASGRSNRTPPHAHDRLAGRAEPEPKRPGRAARRSGTGGKTDGVRVYPAGGGADAEAARDARDRGREDERVGPGAGVGEPHAVVASFSMRRAARWQAGRSGGWGPRPAA